MREVIFGYNYYVRLTQGDLGRMGNLVFFSICHFNQKGDALINCGLNLIPCHSKDRFSVVDIAVSDKRLQSSLRVHGFQRLRSFEGFISAAAAVTLQIERDVFVTDVPQSIRHSRRDAIYHQFWHLRCADLDASQVKNIFRLSSGVARRLRRA